MSPHLRKHCRIPFCGTPGFEERRHRHVLANMVEAYGIPLKPEPTKAPRHILFFVNWVARHRRNLLFWRRCRFEWKVIRVWAFLVCERLRIVLEMGKGALS